MYAAVLLRGTETVRPKVGQRNGPLPLASPLSRGTPLPLPIFKRYIALQTILRRSDRVRGAGSGDRDDVCVSAGNDEDFLFQKK